MSMSDAQRFARELAANKAFADKIKAKAAGLASLVALGKAEGYSFTIDEIKQVIRAMAKRDLTDKELNLVTGGAAAEPATNAVAVTVTSEFIAQTAVQQIDISAQVMTQATIVIN